jgi:hypothetical protein
MSVPFMKQMAWYLIFAMFIIGIAPKAEAGFSPSEIISLSRTDRAADMETIQKAIEIKMVKERLQKLGFTQEEINNRLSQLSDQQIHKVAVQLDQLKVGGDGLGIVIAILIIAILVVVLIMLTGHRVIVK